MVMTVKLRVMTGQRRRTSQLWRGIPGSSWKPMLAKHLTRWPWRVMHCGFHGEGRIWRVSAARGTWQAERVDSVRPARIVTHPPLLLPWLLFTLLILPMLAGRLTWMMVSICREAPLSMAMAASSLMSSCRDSGETKLCDVHHQQGSRKKGQ